MSDKDLSEEEKDKKEKEVAQRLEEIKNRLKKSDKSKSTKTDSETQQKASTSQDKPKTKSMSTQVDKKDDMKEPKKQKRKEANPDPKTTDEKKKSSEPEKKETSGFKMAGKPTNDTSWSGNKVRSADTRTKANSAAKVKTSSSKSEKFKPEIKSKQKKKRRALLVFTFVVLVLVASALVWFFLIMPTSDQNKELISDAISDEVVMESDASNNDNQDSGEELNMMDSESQPADAEPTNDIGNTNAFDSEDNSNNQRVKEEKRESSPPQIKPKPKPKTTTSTANISKTQLNTPCFVISYVSVSSESNAKSQVASLKNKGLSAGYYWIPDYTEGGSELFKVFVGPYPNRQSAHGDLDRIRGFKKDVYYHIVE